jgi:isopentenyl-diphosphate Delta-isomerase
VTVNGASMRVSFSVKDVKLTSIVDYILFIKPTAEITLDVNPNEVQDSKYVTQEELKSMFADGSLKFTPWFKLICQSMLFEWWSHLDQGLEQFTGEKEIRRMLEPPKNTQEI